MGGVYAPVISQAVVDLFLDPGIRTLIILGTASAMVALPPLLGVLISEPGFDLIHGAIAPISVVPSPPGIHSWPDRP